LNWNEIKSWLDDGRTVYGNIFDLDHGTKRKWGRSARIYKRNR
jgi:hypothetical protein